MEIIKQSIMGVTGYRVVDFNFTIGIDEDDVASVSSRSDSRGFKFISKEDYETIVKILELEENSKKIESA